MRIAPPTRGDDILAVWARQYDDGQPVPQRHAVADGCAYLLFAFDAARGGRRELLHARLIGPRIRPFLIDDRPRLCVGVRIAPGFAQAAFGLPASEFLDRRLDYGVVYSTAPTDLAAIQAAETDVDRVTRIVALARQRFRKALAVPHGLRAAVAHIVAAGGNLRVDALADRIGVTRQHLARQFALHVGMSVKQFARIRRAEVARALAVGVRRAHRGRLNWAAIAHRSGYYDQAHLIGEFKALTGQTPEQWIR